MLTNTYQRQVAEAIKEVESHTDAEVIAVVAREADNYLYISTLWAAFITLLLSPLIDFLPFWLNLQQVITLQWVLFIALAVIFRWRPITMHLVPKKIKFWRASNLARRHFLEQDLHSTKDRLGLLIFVSESEHYVEILADRGISKLITNDNWQRVIESFVREIKRGKSGEALLSCIEQCGDLLQQAIPTSTIKDELSNHLIIIN
ncbi:TPM domain-containing protein [Microbulbifer sp. OS29]|uniref:TPM domain-containing protein n=1 Tax=Microbulbifer okhotskensis TaxID=2926617 RepID=A0A9X2EKK7_9GAMM|nr:TPM domain-containing protein [Microbulbifer okhotskensis]MCO1333907.1 TPM domain-containing protein [Microbulbifer okhotskensis]